MRPIPFLAKTTTAILLLTLLVFSSCIEITEKWKINRDGSGSVMTSFNMETMMELMQEFARSQGKDISELEPAFDTMMVKMNESVVILGGCPGITNIKLKGDPETFSFSLGYDFKSISALNNAIARMNEKAIDPSGNPMGSFMPSSIKTKYSLNNNVFLKDLPEDVWDYFPEGTRQKFEDGKAALEKMKKGEETPFGNGEQLMQLFEQMSYNVIYEFEQEVKKAKNKDFTISGDRHTVSTSFSLNDLFEEKIFEDQKIVLK